MLSNKSITLYLCFVQLKTHCRILKARVWSMVPIPHPVYTRFIDYAKFLRTWNAYYEPSSQLLCQMVSPPAYAPSGTATSWHYHPVEITHTSRFLTVSTSNDTVLLETPTLLRCSLPPMSPDFVLATIRSPICATFADYVMTLPMWEQDLLIHAMEKPLATFINCRNKRMLPSWSSAMAVPLPIMAPSGRYLALTRKSYADAKASHEAAELKGIFASPYSCCL
jgi:hypothetical protein